MGQLALQVADYNSELYKGNVTIRTGNIKFEVIYIYIY